MSEFSPVCVRTIRSTVSGQASHELFNLVNQNPILDRCVTGLSYKLGVNVYVVKPVDFHEFVNAIKELGPFWAIISEPPREA